MVGMGAPWENFMKRILEQNSGNCNGFAVENAVNSATEKVMTVGKVAEVLGVSSEAIKKHVREMFPECIKNGVTTYLNEYQVTLIKKKDETYNKGCRC